MGQPQELETSENPPRKRTPSSSSSSSSPSSSSSSTNSLSDDGSEPNLVINTDPSSEDDQHDSPQVRGPRRSRRLNKINQGQPTKVAEATEAGAPLMLTKVAEATQAGAPEIVGNTQTEDDVSTQAGAPPKAVTTQMEDDAEKRDTQQTKPRPLTVTFSDKVRAESPKTPEGMKSPATSAANTPILQQAKGRRRVPPITVYETKGYTTLIGQIQGKLTGALSTSYKGNSIVYQATNPEHFQYLKDEFRKKKLEFFTYNDNPKSTLKVVIKRLIPYWETDDIKQALLEKGFLVQEVYQMASPKTRMTESGEHMSAPRRKGPNYQVNLLNTEEVQKIFQLKRLQYMTVTVERYKRPSGPTQCYICQRFRHGANQCYLTPRCVKCAGPHLSSVCKMKPEEPAKCANCAGNHPASFRGCPVRMKLIQAQEQMRAPPQARSRHLPTTPNQELPITTPHTINNPQPVAIRTPKAPQPKSLLPLPQTGANVNQAESQQQQLQHMPPGPKTMAQAIQAPRPKPQINPRPENVKPQEEPAPSPPLPQIEVPPPLPPQIPNISTPAEKETTRVAAEEKDTQRPEEERKASAPTTAESSTTPIPADAEPSGVEPSTTSLPGTHPTQTTAATPGPAPQQQTATEQPMQFLQQIWNIIKSMLSDNLTSLLNKLTQACGEIMAAPDMMAKIAVILTKIVPLFTNGQ
ncbi:uncharacterized protein LOC124712434 [Schistocerca piceifrons]|uniref:uncharacterized protein LOC124712434 n=1 Tax=Schistocerca piceifrons TaxID=274613 RepID=UPI001F5F6284|nr:uncharacterized protein LOC124712434 [Schistocerca piceifrons]